MGHTSRSREGFAWINFMVNFEKFTPSIGEEILIFGKNKANQILMENISETIKSTPYVVATGIKGRTQKEYKF